MVGEVYWSEKTEKKGQTLAFWVLLLTGSMILGFSSSRVPKKVCLPFGFWHPGLVRRKKPSPPESPLRGGGVLSSLSQRSSLITRRFYASGCPGWSPRQS